VGTFDIDRAMWVYLGGPPENDSIDLANGLRRLEAEFGPQATQVKKELDRILDDFAKPAARRGIPDGHTLDSWITAELPATSNACRQKIAAYLTYYMAR
jgi:hypothetical protein